MVALGIWFYFDSREDVGLGPSQGEGPYLPSKCQATPLMIDAILEWQATGCDGDCLPHRTSLTHPPKDPGGLDNPRRYVKDKNDCKWYSFRYCRQWQDMGLPGICKILTFDEHSKIVIIHDNKYCFVEPQNRGEPIYDCYPITNWKTEDDFLNWVTEIYCMKLYEKEIPDKNKRREKCNRIPSQIYSLEECSSIRGTPCDPNTEPFKICTKNWNHYQGSPSFLDCRCYEIYPRDPDGTIQGPPETICRYM